MGAEPFEYFVPYQEDVAAALAELRHSEFTEFMASGTATGMPEHWLMASSAEELQAILAEEDSFIGGILELGGQLIGPGGNDEIGAIRLLSPAEVQDFFGTGHPTRADFDRAYASAFTTHAGTGPGAAPGPCFPGCAHRVLPERYGARCVVLYDHSGQPTEIAFWGISGD